MNAEGKNLSKILSPLGLSDWQYHPVLDSTNDIALAWAREGAADGALVLADTQLAGRGRGERCWVTKPGAGLAFSLVLRPSPAELGTIPRFTALAALGFMQAVKARGVQAELKWPNDILLLGKKVAGVLVEVDWLGDTATALVMGMGVNVSLGSVPSPSSLRYPATSVEDVVGQAVDRWELLADTLRGILALRPILTEDAFLRLWNEHLAFRGRWIPFQFIGKGTQRMKVLGVTSNGELSLEGEDGKWITAFGGEIGIAYN